jgi:hypothetical protein
MQSMFSPVCLIVMKIVKLPGVLQDVIHRGCQGVTRFYSTRINAISLLRHEYYAFPLQIFMKLTNAYDVMCTYLTPNSTQLG